MSSGDSVRRHLFTAPPASQAEQEFQGLNGSASAPQIQTAQYGGIQTDNEGFRIHEDDVSLVALVGRYTVGW